MTLLSGRGKAVTFYSWKGGTGRTMALANVAVQLARGGRNVLMVDFDLEAPGLERYFTNEELLRFSPALDPSGVVGMLREAATRASGATQPSDWRDRLAEIVVPPSEPTTSRSYVPTPGKLNLLASGKGKSDYAHNLASFSWNRFYEDERGGEWLEALRDEWIASYDFVLVDSRTGLTDTGGVCTVQLPDILVLVFTANNQSFEGGLDIMRAAQAARKEYVFERSPLTVIPLLSRWEGDKEVDLAEVWKKRFDAELSAAMSSWLPLEFKPRQFLEKSRVPHVARFSFGEPLPVLTHGVTDPDLPGLSYDMLARLLDSGVKEAGRIIDPNYREPVLATGEVDENDSTLLSLISDEAALHGEIASLQKMHGKISGELCQFLRQAGTRLFRLGRAEEAEPLLRRALAITEKLQGRGHPEVAVDLTNLALLLQGTGRLSEAEPLFRRALALSEATAGRDDPAVAVSLLNLASVLKVMNRPRSAEPLLRRALSIYEAARGSDHPSVASTLTQLAAMLQHSGRLSEAEAQYRRALSINEATYGPTHQIVAANLSDFALVLRDIGRLPEAESLLRRAIAADEVNFGPGHPDVATNLIQLASLLRSADRLDEAETLLRRALAISEDNYGSDHAVVVAAVKELASLLKETSRVSEAHVLLRRAGLVKENREERGDPAVPRSGIFISYAHQDLVWVERLRMAMAPMIGQTEIQAWDERSIPPGHDWAAAVDEAMASTRVSVLMVSQNYLASGFIFQSEIPRLVERYRGDMGLFWVPLETSLYQETVLGQIQAAWDPGRPLAGLTTPEYDRALVEIGEKIMQWVASGPVTAKGWRVRRPR